MAKKAKKEKIQLKGDVLNLFAKMDSEGGLLDFIHWGGLEDAISRSIQKQDPQLFDAMLAVKSALDLFEKEADRYEVYTGAEDFNA